MVILCKLPYATKSVEKPVKDGFCSQTSAVEVYSPIQLSICFQFVTKMLPLREKSTSGNVGNANRWALLRLTKTIKPLD